MSHLRLGVSVASIIVLGAAGLAQVAKVPVEVSPRYAYVFLDGVAIREGENVTLKTTPGEHTIGVYSYGFKGEDRKVEISAGKNKPLSFKLRPTGEKVSGPFGYIQIEGPARAAVLLNGDTPQYCVGHVDMFNNHIGFSQQLLVPAGTHQLTITRMGKTYFSGPVEVHEGERVTLWTKDQHIKRQMVSANANAARPRSNTGDLTARISIAPVSGTFSASASQINCNDSAKLDYASSETVDSSITDDSGTKQLSASAGEIPVEPRRTTTYRFHASGPGGIVNQEATVDVDPTVQASLETKPAEVHYLKVGDKVLLQDSAQLQWRATNADNVALDPIGSVAANDNQQVTPVPTVTDGRINETKTYTLTATNVCGGSDTKTAQIQIQGMITPPIESVFFPTGYPAPHQPEVGLVASQQERLLQLIEIFPEYANRTPDAKIVVRGFADPRGTKQYNMALSERRAAVVKAFLVSHGIAEDKIAVEAIGANDQLDAETVARLDAENPNKPQDSTKGEARTAQLAYNRRIDIVVEPADVETARVFPYRASDSEVLAQRSWPSRNEVIGVEVQPSAMASPDGGK